MSIYDRYVDAPIGINAQTIQQTIQTGIGIGNGCWINASTDSYCNKVVEIIGRDDVHQKGASIHGRGMQGI